MTDHAKRQELFKTIIVWWSEGNSKTKLTMHEVTKEYAIESAYMFGYKAPVWYMPWTYLTRKLNVSYL